MALILRIDVDRPYGKRGFLRHCCSRIASDFWFPRIDVLNYLDELKTLLKFLNQKGIAAYVFYRVCTTPSNDVIKLMNDGGHRYGLHMENSRTYRTFLRERSRLENILQRKIKVFSKHGSGSIKYGWHHYFPYEPEKYCEWALDAGMTAFFGNKENPALEAYVKDHFTYYPSAFWLEPSWRDTSKYPIHWLVVEALKRDIVMLMHPDNVLASNVLLKQLDFVLDSVPTVILDE